MPTVKFTNDVELDSASVKMGIDVNNVLASGGYGFPSNVAYSVDAWVYIRGQQYYGGPYGYIDGKEVYSAGNPANGDGGQVGACFFLKAGQKPSVNRADFLPSYKIYGTK